MNKDESNTGLEYIEGGLDQTDKKDKVPTDPCYNRPNSDLDRSIYIISEVSKCYSTFLSLFFILLDSLL